MNYSKKLIVLFTIVLALLIIPAGFSADNSTADEIVQSTDYENELLTNNSYYDSSLDENGNGSVDNPYNNLDSYTFKPNTVNYLKDGEYDLTFSPSADNITIIGTNTDKTIITGNNVNINVVSSLNLINVTLKNIRINLAKNTTFNAINTNISGINGANQGGAIYGIDGSAISLINSTIENTAADFGGAIYINNGTLEIVNSYLINNYATFGGAIYSLNSNFTLVNVTGVKNNAKFDGGAIYHLKGNFSCINSTFLNNSASNGGALFIDSSTNVNITLNTFKNNNASYVGGALYLFDNKNSNAENNVFVNNNALKYNDTYDVDALHLFLGDGNVPFIRISIDDISDLPSFYSSLDEGYITSVKNQGSNGNCWAFASLATLEACIKKATGITFDFSESNMKNLMGSNSEYGWLYETNKGGTTNMGIGYLVSWLGPINESDDPYVVNTVFSPVLNSLFHVQNIAFVSRSNYTDNDEIKSAILKNGAVAASIYWHSSHVKGSSYYQQGTTSLNHAITIVGWDDNYSKSNFKNTPPGDGAWIIKNSWGQNSGNNGYYYVSYYDEGIVKPGRTDVAYTFILNDTMIYDKNYQYDIPGKTDIFLTSNSEVYYQNIFNSTDNEYLAAVSTYFSKFTNYELSIYVNNVLKLTQTGSSNIGYYTINLNEMIPLNAGDQFKIMFKVIVDKEASFPISEVVSLNKYFYAPGVSFFSYDGENWIDLYNWSGSYLSHTYTSQVACIKAFTIFDKLNSTIKLSFDGIGDNDPSYIIVNVSNQYGAPAIGNVTLDILGDKISATLINGIANISYIFKSFGKIIVNVQFNATGYNASSAVGEVEIHKTQIMANEFITYYMNECLYSVKLIDESGNPVSGKIIKFTFNAMTYENITGEDGIAYIAFKLANGDYPIYISFAGDDKNVKSQNLSVISVKTTILPISSLIKTLNSYYQFKVLDVNGNPLKNTNVDISVNGVVYHVTTDLNGIASLLISQNPSEYSLTLTNLVNNEKLSLKLTVNPRIVLNTNVVKFYGASNSYKVRVTDDNGNPVGSGEIVTFNVNGKTYNIKTDKNGWATRSIALTPGTYTVTATYKGFTVSNKVTVKNLISAKNLSKKKAKKIKFSAKLVNSKGKIVKNKKLTFKIKGKTYKVKTNKKGIATVSLKNLKVGKYKIVVSYGKCKLTKTIKIRK